MLVPLAKVVAIVLWGAATLPARVVTDCAEPCDAQQVKIVCSGDDAQQVKIVGNEDIDLQQIEKLLKSNPQACAVDVDTEDGLIVIKLVKPDAQSDGRGKACCESAKAAKACGTKAPPSCSATCGVKVDEKDGRIILKLMQPGGQACSPAAAGGDKLVKKILQSCSATCCVGGKDGRIVLKLGQPQGSCCAKANAGCPAGAGVLQKLPQIVAGAQPQIIRAPGAPQFAAQALTLARDGDDDQVIMALQPDAPPQWIGVLMAEVPEPLAAHVGSSGLMIANVVEGSPADKAGLKRYDVVVAFDGQKVDDMEDLISAIRGVEVGEQTEIVVKQGGETKTLSIAPAKRPEPGTWSYMYEEPEEEHIDESVRLRGHRLVPGPGGAWIMQDLGPMTRVPEVLEKLEKLDSDALKELRELDDSDLKTWIGKFDPEDFDFDVKVFTEPHVWLDMGRGDADADVRVELSVQVDDDGNVTTIRRDADGKIHVKQVDADGNESSATYDSAEEFKQEDPEGYELYQRYSGSGMSSWKVKVPIGEHLGAARKRYQIAVEKALEHSQQAQKQAQEAAEEARKQIEIMLKKHQAEAQPAPEPAPAETLAVQVEDGQITVTVTKGDHKRVYQFDSKEEFKQSEPKLYQKVRSLFE